MRAMDEEFITAHAKSLGIPSQNEKSCFSKRELWTALELKGVNRALDIIYRSPIAAISTTDYTANFMSAQRKTPQAKMLATFIIGLREEMEAALIVGIIADFLRRNGKSLVPVWLGVTLASPCRLSSALA
jgi:hypothetical protein